MGKYFDILSTTTSQRYSITDVKAMCSPYYSKYKEVDDELGKLHFLESRQASKQAIYKFDSPRAANAFAKQLDPEKYSFRIEKNYGGNHIWLYP